MRNGGTGHTRTDWPVRNVNTGPSIGSLAKRSTIERIRSPSLLAAGRLRSAMYATACSRSRRQPATSGCRSRADACADALANVVVGYPAAVTDGFERRHEPRLLFFGE